MAQSEVADALAALRVGWRRLRPSPPLWRWVDALDARLARLCARADAGEALDEAWDARGGVRVAAEDFVADAASTLCDAFVARAAEAHLLRRCPLVEDAPPGLPVEAARAWLAAEAARRTEDAREAHAERLAEHRVRPGEMDRYARAHLGVVPADLRVVLAHSRPTLARPEADASGDSYLVFDGFCARREFPWADMALLLDRRYFRAAPGGGRLCDVMLSLRQPTALRVMGAHYVVLAPRAWTCASAEEALCLWAREVAERYESETEVWDLRFVKDLYALWLRGPEPARDRVRIA